MEIKKQTIIPCRWISYIFRAYYALPPLSRKMDGFQLCGKWFLFYALKLLEDSRSDDSIYRPTHFAVIFDQLERILK